MDKTIAVLSGDGIGPEIMKEAIKVIEAISEKYNHKFDLDYADFGGIAYDNFGHPFPEKTKIICDNSDAILKGPVGAPKYDSISDPQLRPERGGILKLRQRYDMFANFRPVKLPYSMRFFSPLKSERIPSSIDILMIRELVGGIYFGKKEEGKTSSGEPYALDSMEYTQNQVERIARIAFNEAKKRNAKIHNIHKSNVLTCSIFWNRIVDRINREEFPEIKVEHMLVDNAAYQLVINPCQFQLMLMENMMGDILTDEAAGIIGSLGLMPSACFGTKSCFEPAHGSAPSIAGKNQANPYSMIGSVALMMEHFSLSEEADSIWNSLTSVFEKGFTTADLQANSNSKKLTVVSTSEFGDLVRKAVFDYGEKHV